MPQIVTREERVKTSWKRYGPIGIAAAVGVVILVVLAVMLGSSIRYNSVEKKAKAFDAKGDYAAEIKVLSAYIDSKPPKKYQYPVMVQLGDLTYAARDYGSSMSWYIQAIEVGPKPPEAHALAGVGKSAAEIGSTSTAVSYFRQAISSARKKSQKDIQMYEDQIRSLGGNP